MATRTKKPIARRRGPHRPLPASSALSSVADGRWALKASESNRGENVLSWTHRPRPTASARSARWRASAAIGCCRNTWTRTARARARRAEVPPQGARPGRRRRAGGGSRRSRRPARRDALRRAKHNRGPHRTPHESEARGRNRNKRRDTRADDASNANAPVHRAGPTRLEVTRAGEGDGMDATETILARARRSIQCADPRGAGRTGRRRLRAARGLFELFGVDFPSTKTGTRNS